MSTHGCLFIVISAWYLFHLTSLSNGDSGCGSYEKLDINKTINLTSPNYPNFTRPSTLCIWLIEAPANYSVSITVTDFLSDSSDCTFAQVVIRNDNRTGNISQKYCDNPVNDTVVSSFRSMWISYSASYSSTVSRFSAIVTTTINPNNNTYSLPKCNQTDFTCPNYQCVSSSYICDNVSDCGCSGTFCDEGDFYCTTYGFVNVLALNYIFSIAVGAAIFILIFLGAAFLDAKRCEPCRKKFRRDVNKEAQRNPVNSALKRMISNFQATSHGSEAGSRRSSQYMTAPGSIAASTASSMHKKISVGSRSGDVYPPTPLSTEEPPTNIKSGNVPKYGSTLLPSDVPLFKPTKA